MFFASNSPRFGSPLICGGKRSIPKGVHQFPVTLEEENGNELE